MFIMYPINGLLSKSYNPNDKNKSEFKGAPVIEWASKVPLKWG